MESKGWYSSKTVWGAVIGIFYGITGLVSGNLTLSEAMPILIVAWSAFGIRLAVD